MSFSACSNQMTSKDTLKMHIRAHNELSRRPRIPQKVFSMIDDAPTTTANLWLKAYNNVEEEERGKALFQIAIEKKIRNLHERDIEDLAGGHYYLSPSEPLLITPAKTSTSAADGFGVVWNGVIKEKTYAVKTIKGAASLALEWKLEREILKSLLHEHLIRLLFSMEQENTVHMVIHPHASIVLSDVFAPTGSPINLKKHPGWLENTFCCLLSALRFLHSKNIKHLDIRPQNILIDDTVSPPNILISNFGASPRFTITSIPDMSEQPGFARWYAAPEQYLSQARRSADIFSIAVVFLEIFVFIRMGVKKQLPQHVLSDPKGLSREGAGKVGNQRVQNLVDRLAEGAVVWLEELASMIKSMMSYTPMERPTARQAHLKMVHIVVGGAALELHCPAQTFVGFDTESDTSGEDSDAAELVAPNGVLEEYLKTMRRTLLQRESDTLHILSENLGGPGLAQFSEFVNSVNATQLGQSRALTETPKKRILENTEQNKNSEKTKEEEGQAKKAKI